MIKIIEKKKRTEKRDPYYILTYKYMIGDGNGDITEKIIISKDNPYLERYVTLLNSLKPVKGNWGIILEHERLERTLEEGQITEDDFKYLEGLMFDGIESDYFDLEEDEFTWEFFEGVLTETEYSFLVFEGLELHYVDEYGEKHETEIV